MTVNRNPKHTFAISRREASEALHEISRPIEGVGNAGCPLHPQPRVRFALEEKHASKRVLHRSRVFRQPALHHVARLTLPRPPHPSPRP
jgi:hypothetical protein